MAAFSLQEYMKVYEKNPTSMARIVSDLLDKQGSNVEVSRQNIEQWAVKYHAVLDVSDVETGEINSFDLNSKKSVYRRQVAKK